MRTTFYQDDRAVAKLLRIRQYPLDTHISACALRDRYRETDPSRWLMFAGIADEAEAAVRDLDEMIRALGGTPPLPE